MMDVIATVYFLIPFHDMPAFSISAKLKLTVKMLNVEIATGFLWQTL